MCRADAVKVDDMALQGPEENLNVRLNKAELGPSDLMLMGSGWSIPVHRRDPTTLTNP